MTSDDGSGGREKVDEPTISMVQNVVKIGMERLQELGISDVSGPIHPGCLANSPLPEKCVSRERVGSTRRDLPFWRAHLPQGILKLLFVIQDAPLLVSRIVAQKQNSLFWAASQRKSLSVKV